MTDYDYIKDGTAIYERSFAIIRSEADLSRFSEAEADVGKARQIGLRADDGKGPLVDCCSVLDIVVACHVLP